TASRLLRSPSITSLKARKFCRSSNCNSPPAASFRNMVTPLKHDPEKWNPVFRKDHAQTKSQSGMPINHDSCRSGRSREIEHTGFAVFGTEGKKTAVRAPGKRADRRIARLPHQNLGAVLNAGEEHHAVAIADGNDRILRVTGDDLDAMLGWRQRARL